MRVIGGEARGRKIVAPDIASVRPTSDRVREAMFDVLAHLGGLEGRNVLDLFAGSGALGIEALSRGAASATFVDSDRNVVATITNNLSAAKFKRPYGAQVVVMDAITFCRAHREHPHDDEIAAKDAEHIGVTFCDPPYSYVNWPKLLTVLPGDLIVLETAKPLELPSSFDLYRVYKYGSTLVTVARRRRSTDEDSAMAADFQVRS